MGGVAVVRGISVDEGRAVRALCLGRSSQWGIVDGLTTAWRALVRYAETRTLRLPARAGAVLHALESRTLAAFHSIRADGRSLRIQSGLGKRARGTESKAARDQEAEQGRAQVGH